MQSMNENPFTSPQSDPTISSGPVPVDKNENSLGILCHLLALTTFLVPFGNILGPLVLWLIKRGSSPYLDELGKEVVNFNISWFIYSVIAGLTLFILVGFLLLPIVLLMWLILVVVAAIKASEGKIYRYPLTIRLIK
jgi:uncharacterized Tic20 family protein